MLRDRIEATKNAIKNSDNYKTINLDHAMTLSLLQVSLENQQQIMEAIERLETRVNKDHLDCPHCKCDCHLCKSCREAKE